jgi:hypothetical protein
VQGKAQGVVSESVGEGAIMAKVYVITKGCYSDYHICAVTLDKEKAERLRKLFDGGSMDEARIEEWDTEQHVDLLSGRKPYFVLFRENGDVLSVTEDEYCIEYFEPKIFVFHHRYYGDVLKTAVYADSREAAVKIAAEKRAKYLAEKEGIA